VVRLTRELDRVRADLLKTREDDNEKLAVLTAENEVGSAAPTPTALRSFGPARR
jgi:hypothetical protein